MACSRARRPLRARFLALLSGAICGLSGCWTTAAYQSARIHESVSGYASAWSDGERLLLGYDVALKAGDGRPLGTAPRAVDLRLADLAADATLAVEAFPMRETAAPPPLGRADRPVTILEDGNEATPSLPARSDTAPAFALRVNGGEGNPDGFDLFASADEGSSWRRVGGLYSDALYRERTAWWFYPCLPFAAAADILLFPLQLATVWPLLLFGR
jgi:hypothetical protein